jgi:hypothetical protein
VTRKAKQVKQAPVASVTREQALNILWEEGDLSWKLDSTQQELVRSYVDSKQLDIIVWACSRRLGKTHTLVTLAIETCLKKKGAIVKFVAPELKQIRSVVRPIFREILEDCPKHLRPKFSTMDNIYKFPNGSEIQLAGADGGNADSIRGGKADLCIIDEAGFVDELHYVVRSILLPTISTTRGRMILASTPPISPSHDFVDYMEKENFRNAFILKTVFDNPRLEKDQLDAIIKQYGGMEDAEFQREYMCRIIKDQTRAIIPEFTADNKSKIVKDVTRPVFFDSYEAMDIGGKDLTVVLFGYYDFQNDKVVIEDEIVIKGVEMTTEILANEIKLKEAALWTNELGVQQAPYLRVSDNNNLILLNDLRNPPHNINFIPTSKENLRGTINQVRIMIKSEKLVIHPRCTTLISHLENGVWNKQRTKFDQSGQFGHYDAIAALIYFVRNVNFNKNPYPAYHDLPRGTRFASPHTQDNQSSSEAAFDRLLKSVYKVK